MSLPSRRPVKVDAVEERLAGAAIVQRGELRRIEEAIGAQAAERQELPTERVPAPRLNSAVGLLNDPMPDREAAIRLLIHARLGDDPHDQTVLVAEFSRRHAGDDLHRLHRLGRQLVRVDPALLIGHRLVVDRELRLRVIADRMKEAVGVGDHAGRGERDHLVQPRRGFERQLLQQALIDVGVRGRIAFEQILGVTDDLHFAGRRRQSQHQIDVDRHRVRTSTSRSSVWKPCAPTLSDSGWAADS